MRNLFLSVRYFPLCIAPRIEIRESASYLSGHSKVSIPGGRNRSNLPNIYRSVTLCRSKRVKRTVDQKAKAPLPLLIMRVFLALVQETFFTLTLACSA